MLTLHEISARMSKLSAWTLDNSSLVKEIELTSFKEAIDYVNKVALIAEKHNHHPDILINFNIVRLSLTTPTEKSVTELDFTVAEEIDTLVND